MNHPINLPALRCKVGAWTYYVSSLTYAQVLTYVKKIDKELHTSKSLQDQIQRSITDNYLSIRDYIINQNEHFFNSLVLAVYDGDPEWVEVELNFEQEDYFNLGFLKLNGVEKIFPVDGQHRVEGIKSAVESGKANKTDTIPVILIGHKNNADGRIKTRRLFSTLNRYAKPVTLGDIIALDEDDAVAIITRHLVEHQDLFLGNRTVMAKQKAMPENDKSALTSLVTLYQCNSALIKFFYEKKHLSKLTKKGFDEYLKFRPKDKELGELQKLIVDFWDSFALHLTDISDYMSSDSEEPAKIYRNSDNGGHMLFRPVGILPFVEACIFIKRQTKKSFDTILARLNGIQMQINSEPWLQILWNSYENKMIMGSHEVVKLMVIYLFDSKLLTPKQLQKLKEGYASKINYKDDVNLVLDGIKPI
jgi:DNA sulfur modification protein DndB